MTSDSQSESGGVVSSTAWLGEQVVELYLCESQSLVLKPNTLYWFRVDAKCERCKSIAAESASLCSPND